jgi:hypothetical protein
VIIEAELYFKFYSTSYGIFNIQKMKERFFAPNTTTSHPIVFLPQEKFNTRRMTPPFYGIFVMPGAKLVISD